VGKAYSGLNAIFEYNGAMIERSTNQFTAGGVTFTLLEADPSKTITVTVSQDTDAIVEKIESFVNKVQRDRDPHQWQAHGEALL